MRIEEDPQIEIEPVAVRPASAKPAAARMSRTKVIVGTLIFVLAVPERLISDYLVVVGAIAHTTKDRPLRTLLLHAESMEDFITTLLGARSI